MKSSSYIHFLSKLYYQISRIQRNSSGLGNFLKFLKKLGSPQDKFGIITVGGTNGKGSVSLKTAAALEKNGIKTGLFISPHLFSIRERIQINRQLIPQDRFIELVQEMIALSQQSLNFFQLMLATTFLYFKEEQIDIAVLQVGMGGIYDPVNCTDSPLATAITSIGYDHMKYLGDTLDSIARNKAGLIKGGVPIILGPNTHPKSVFYEKMKECNPE